MSRDFIFFAYKEEKSFWSVVIYFIAKRNVRLGWYEAFIYFIAKRNVRLGWYEAYKSAKSISACEYTGAQYGKYAEMYTDRRETKTLTHN